jgi:ABC-type Fe3+/spermidine/putrescine transport system ATPase subunit
VVFPTAEYVQRLVQEEQLLRIPRDKLENLDNIYSYFDDPWYDPDSADGVRLSTGQLSRAVLPEGSEQGASVHCSVRPEKIFLDDLIEDGMVSVEGTIVERIYLGTTTQVIIELAPDVRVISVEQNTDRSRADDRWEIGQRVRLGWHPEHALVLR